MRKFDNCYNCVAGEVAEWLKAHAWKACRGAILSQVRILFSPPGNYMAKHLLIISLSIVIVGLIFLVVRWKGNSNMTFSQYAATSKISSIYYAALFMVALPPMYYFFTEWFIPSFNLPSVFNILLITSLIAQILCTLFPETGYRKTIIHRLTASVSALTFLPLLIILLTSTSISMSIKILTVISIVSMGILLIIAFIRRNNYKHALYIQIAYYVLFFTPIIAITYINTL